MKKLLFIYNAKSGKAMVKRNLADIIDTFIKAGYTVEAYQTQKAGDATEQIIARGEEFEHIVCCGGDGTLNETVSGLMQIEKRPTLGYIPGGSTNDFANSLKLPKNMVNAAKVAVCGKEAKIDVGDFNGKKFIYIAGFGAFTDVSYQTPQELKNVLGHQAYLIEAVKKLPQIKGYYISCRFDGCILEGEFIYGMVSNSSSVAGIQGITGKDISLNDGMFEVTLVRPPKNIIELQAMIAELLNGGDNCENVIRFKTHKLTVTSEESIAWVLDGESGGSTKKAVISNIESAITMKAYKK